MKHRWFRNFSLCFLILFTLFTLITSLSSNNYIYANKSLYEKGLYLLRNGNKEEAKEIFKDIFTQSPNNYYAPYSMYKYAQLIETVDDVIYYLGLIGEKYPNFDNLDSVYNDLGTIHFLMKDYKKSKKSFYKVYKNFPQSELTIRAMYYIGKCFFKEGDYDKALRWYDALYRSYPKDYYASLSLFEIGYLYEGNKDFDKALVYYTKMREEYPGSDAISKALYRQALIYGGVKKEKEKAYQLMALILVEYPKSFEADFVKRRLGENITEENFIRLYYPYEKSNQIVSLDESDDKTYSYSENILNDDGKYFIQLGAFKYIHSAESYADRLREDNFKPQVRMKKELISSSKSELYLVIIGYFKESNTAISLMEKLKEKGYDCYIVMRD